MDVEQSGTTSSQRPDIFTVYAREVPFQLTRGQIESDSPNYFTTAFLDGGFAESNSKIIHLDQHPRLFSLIVEHLSGYPILPLQPSTIPSFLSIEMAQESLLRDAQYFGLEGLQKAFAAYLPPPPPPPTIPQSLQTYFRFDGIVDVREFDRNRDLKLTTGSTTVGIVGRKGRFLLRATNVPIRLSLQKTEYEDQREKMLLMPCIAARIEWSLNLRSEHPRSLTRELQILDDTAQFTLNSTPMVAHSLIGLLQRWEKGSTTSQDPIIDAYSTDPERLDEALLLEDDSQEQTVPTLDVIAKSLVFELELNPANLGPRHDFAPYTVRWRFADLVDAKTWSIPQWNEAIKYVDGKEK